jgi:hypothetical protein
VIDGKCPAQYRAPANGRADVATSTWFARRSIGQLGLRMRWGRGLGSVTEISHPLVPAFVPVRRALRPLPVNPCGAPTGTESARGVALLKGSDFRVVELESGFDRSAAEMLRPEDNPPMCPPDVVGLAELTGDWWVAHTKPRFEKTLAFELLAKGIPYYLPLVTQVKMSGGRKRRTMLPLFPSYLFFCGDGQARYDAMTTNRIVQVLQVRDREQFVAELTLIERALRQNAFLESFPSIPIGRRARVKAGPFMGLEGTVVERNKRMMLVMQVSMLGSGASLEIEADLLEAAD